MQDLKTRFARVFYFLRNAFILYFTKATASGIMVCIEKINEVFHNVC